MSHGVMAEATCRVVVSRCAHCANPRHQHFDHRHVDPCPFGDCGPDNYLADDCGAPIPRLDEGPCQMSSYTGPGTHFAEEVCGKPRDNIRHWYYLGPGTSPSGVEIHSYLGPLASECAAGHPVAVPSESERRG